MKIQPLCRTILAICFLVVGCVPLGAQFYGAGARDNFKDTSILRPPTGSEVAIIVFEDLGCPACAHAHPIEAEVARQTHVPLLRYDFPIAGHVWTFEGAVCARYIQDKVSPRLADEYRSAVFAAQMSISGKEDLQQFTRKWLQDHGQLMPFVLDPAGTLAKKVQADFDLGRRLNVQYTPTVVVVSRTNYQVICGTKDGPSDPQNLLPAVQGALAQAKTPALTHSGAASQRR